MNAQTKIEVPTLAKLRESFPEHQISKLPKATKAQNDAVKEDFKKGIRCKVCGGWHHPEVVHLDYVGHAALTDRLLDTDPNWYWEPVAFDETGLPAFDRIGGLWIRLHVLGQSRLGYGDADGKTGGNAVKEAIGDALRNAAMRFGAALDLWHKGELHADEGTAGGQGQGTVSPPPPPSSASTPDLPTGPINDTTRDWLASKIDARQIPVGDLCRAFGAANLKQITYAQLDLVKAWIADRKPKNATSFAEELNDAIDF